MTFSHTSPLLTKSREDISNKNSSVICIMLRTCVCFSVDNLSLSTVTPGKNSILLLACLKHPSFWVWPVFIASICPCFGRGSAAQSPLPLCYLHIWPGNRACADPLCLCPDASSGAPFFPEWKDPFTLSQNPYRSLQDWLSLQMFRKMD